MAQAFARQYETAGDPSLLVERSAGPFRTATDKQPFESARVIYPSTVNGRV
jgi:hypothetical protein